MTWKFPKNGEYPKYMEKVLCHVKNAHGDHKRGILSGTLARKDEWFIGSYITCNPPLAWCYYPKPPKEEEL